MLGLLSVNSNIISDVVLILQWILFVILLIDWYIARKRDIKNHRRIVLTLFALQTIFNLYMVTRVPEIEIFPILFLHAISGIFGYGLIVYTILYMTNNLPERLRIVPKERRKLLMQVTTIIWLIFIFSGTNVYIMLYL